MKKLLWDSSWHRIQFSSLNVKLKFFSRASAQFYEKYYDKLFEEYKGFEELPSDWQDIKKGTVDGISKLIGNEKRLLSIGCGIGYVEQDLLLRYPNLRIDGYDFAPNAGKWLRSVKGFNELKYFPSNGGYSFVYSTQLLYALSNKELEEFSRSIKNALEQDGVFLTVDTSSRPSENGLPDESVGQKLRSYLKNFIRPVFLFCFHRKNLQFQGWLRENKDIIKCFEKNGFVVIRAFSQSTQSFIAFRIRKVS